MCASDLFEGKNLIDQHLQLSFGSNLERESEVIGRINRVSEDRNHVKIDISHRAERSHRHDHPQSRGGPESQVKQALSEM